MGKAFLRSFVVVLSIFASCQWSIAQSGFSWIEPRIADVNGKIAHNRVGIYDRLPESLQSTVRAPVWQLSRNSAGLYLDFFTKASHIVVKYKVAGRLNMPHMATTGVSGIDLYALEESSDSWSWASGEYSFTDTITYSYEGLRKTETGRRYRLYLPLYNTVKWLKIGVPDSDTIQFFSQKEPPIIVYGTSIAQGACASRPGLAWTNLLGRMTDTPIVNLGFSGNGRLEKPILDLLAATPAAIIVLDCLPNLGISDERTEKQIDSLIYNAVGLLREAHPETPIILTEHSSGFNCSILNEDKLRSYEMTTLIARLVVNRLRKEGVDKLFVLNNESIGLSIDSTVDYAHPNDIGMKKIAAAYFRLIKRIEKERDTW